MGDKNRHSVRIEYIDVARAIAMIFVILGHINFANSSIKVWVYSFHMPVFFIISGMVIRSRDEYKGKDFLTDIYKSFLNLMVPYFLWAMIYCKLTPSNLLYVFYGSYDALTRADTLTSLWFLPVMFISLSLFRLFALIFKNRFNIVTKLILAIVVMSIGFVLPSINRGYPWGINISLVSLGFVLLGNIIAPFIYKLYYEKMVKPRKIASILISIGLVICCFVVTLLYKFNIPEYGYVLMGNGIFGNILLFLPVSIVGTAMTIFGAWFFCLFGIKKIIDFFSFIGKNTLAIFFVQKPIISFFSVAFGKLNVPELVALCITCICTLLLSCAIAMVIKKIAPNLLGVH